MPRKPKIVRPIGRPPKKKLKTCPRCGLRGWPTVKHHHRTSGTYVQHWFSHYDPSNPYDKTPQCYIPKWMRRTTRGRSGARSGGTQFPMEYILGF